MNKKDYIWAFRDTALSSGLDGALSLEYHVPASRLKVEPGDLVGSRIWLVARKGDESFLYAFLTPSLIERYDEGKYKGDFILRCEPFFSVRFLPRQEARNPWRLPFNGSEEVRECTDAERSILLETVIKNQRVGFAPPSRAILESVHRTAFSDLERAVPDQLMSTFRTVSLGDVSRSRSLPDSVSALGGVALAILKSTHPHLNEADMIVLISALDPLARVIEDTPLQSSRDILRVLSSLPPIVDTFLEEIDPEKISPRTFVARASDYSLEWLDKTNDAEQAHEQILKDLVVYLKDEGFKVYKTRSFDLFAEKAGVRLLWEVKSANGFNSVSQGEKGIVQLLRYATALSDDGSNDVKFFLLLQDSDQPAVQRYLSKMARRAGVALWLYDGRKDWPQRVFNLESETLPG